MTLSTHKVNLYASLNKIWPGDGGGVIEWIIFQKENQQLLMNNLLFRINGKGEIQVSAT